MSVGRQHGIQSIEVGHRLLQALAAAPRPMMLRDLASAARMPASKAHRYLVSFVRIGLVEQQAESGRYDLGGFALGLGLAALGRLDAVTLATPLLHELSDELNETVAIAVWANRGPTIVRWVGADSPVSATLRVGSVMPLTRSATGLTFAAFGPEPRCRSLLRQELAVNARRRVAPGNPAALQKRLRSIRSNGYAWVTDFIAGVSGSAVPVFGADGALALALVALGHSAAFDQRRAVIAQRLLRAARILSRRLGSA